MKKVLSIAMMVLMLFVMGACGEDKAKQEEGSKDKQQNESKKSDEKKSEDKAEKEDEKAELKTVKLSVSNAAGEQVEVSFPVSPKKVAVLNYQTLDFMDAMGLGDMIAGTITGSMPQHLKKYEEDENIVKLGGMKDIDLEALAALEPDVIFSSDRTRKMYDKFSEIAPTFSAYLNYKDGFLNSYKELAGKHAAIFGLDKELDEKITGYEKRINAINEKFSGSTALLGIFADGLNTLGNVGRCSLVVNELGFVNQSPDKDVNHGNKSSYEVFLDINPEYMFIIDKDNAVGRDAVAAKQQMDNEIIKQTDAFKNNKIIYLEPSDAWYLADGGITAMDLMLKGLEEGLGMND